MISRVNSGIILALVSCLILETGKAADGPAAAGPATEAKTLLLGNYADPTIVKDGNDYYMTHSSFQYQPGLLVWHSTDLLNWTPISRAVVNQSGSIWAPDIIKHDGRFYIYYPADGDNWVVTAGDPHGPWSEPVSLGVGRIDPGHIASPDGKRYLHLSAGNALVLSQDGLKAETEMRTVYDGWPIPEDWAVECPCLESPKLNFRNGWYYMTSAQGGTAGVTTSHMVVAARSKNPLGPWTNSPYNPILRTWDRDEKWWSKGHGTIVEGPGGQWYCVLHGYRNGYRSLGRATIMEPIEWTSDGWYRRSPGNPPDWDVPVTINMPTRDEFDGNELGIQWQFDEHYDASRFEISDGALTLKAYGDDPGSSRPLFVMPMNRAYEVTTEFEIDDGATAGLMLFASSGTYIGTGLSGDGKLHRVQEGFRRYARHEAKPEVNTKRITLRIVNNKQDVRFYYMDSQKQWRILTPSMDVSSANHNVTGGWATLCPGVFVTGKGQARFHSFEYRGLD
jgi:xylan 1,4-beta-xylosidase